MPLYNEDETEENHSDDKNNLLPTVKTLLPVRNRKLKRLENELREQQFILLNLKERLRTGEEKLNGFREEYKKCLKEFSLYHTGVVLLQEQLHQVLRKESRIREKLLEQEKENYETVIEIDSKETFIEEMKKEIQPLLREIEKLDYLMNEQDF